MTKSDIEIICKKTWLSEKEAEDYTGLGPDTLRRLRTFGTARGILPHCKIGNTIRYKKAEIDKFFSQHTVRSRIT